MQDHPYLRELHLRWKGEEEKILLIVTDKISKNIKDNENFSEFLLIEEFTGFNYSKGESVIFKVYKN